jgi:hypothetical protein
MIQKLCSYLSLVTRQNNNRWIANKSLETVVKFKYDSNNYKFIIELKVDKRRSMLVTIQFRILYFPYFYLESKRFDFTKLYVTMKLDLSL